VLSGTIAYLNDWWGVRILNVADPSNPTEVAFYPTSQDTAWLALSGDRLYVAEGSYGVEVVDVSDPAAPVWVGSFDTLGSARTLTIAGSNLLVSDAEAVCKFIPGLPGVAASCATAYERTTGMKRWQSLYQPGRRANIPPPSLSRHYPPTLFPTDRHDLHCHQRRGQRSRHTAGVSVEPGQRGCDRL